MFPFVAWREDAPSTGRKNGTLQSWGRVVGDSTARLGAKPGGSRGLRGSGARQPATMMEDIRLLSVPLLAALVVLAPAVAAGTPSLGNDGDSCALGEDASDNPTTAEPVLPPGRCRGTLHEAPEDDMHDWYRVEALGADVHHTLEGTVCVDPGGELVLSVYFASRAHPVPLAGLGSAQRVLVQPVESEDCLDFTHTVPSELDALTGGTWYLLFGGVGEPTYYGFSVETEPGAVHPA